MRRKQTNAFSAVFLNGNFSKEDWYIDSGASTHLTVNESWAINTRYGQKEEIIVANSNKLQVLCTGDVNIITKTDEFEYEVPIKGVLRVPELTSNLLSISQLLKNGNKREGIIHQKSNPYTPEQNGFCERRNRSIVEKARCLLFDAQLGKDFWTEATNTAVYLQNRIVASGLEGKTPYEIWTGSKPNLSHLRVFGSKVMVHIAKEKRQKWDKKSEQHILVGYPDGVKGYRVYNPRSKKITTSRDVIIIEPTDHSEVMLPLERSGQNTQITEENTIIEDKEDTDESDTTLFSDETYVPGCFFKKL
ncbi:uncharacterized protein LOC111362695 [Spodoptera litura]|uniref:Uncharacterized protein LOC111362695 n=1 Tax=Spodoptera litura TaxID=69820 RepID=A0A9J7J1F3_SPOLT|nr:uncharacterized protein LOC111362695 [Spodoptera litura]